ncbi:PREDICTED: leucine-rich repeat extensin-like protein 5, partial [Nelumbo nucifera]|uniref:Leucine-rich repeat extensin-like protein 5 n=1 Tax=Nelumbo nucifera TaxID=4432 RepID=A0A1U8AQL2_NELNU
LCGAGPIVKITCKAGDKDIVKYEKTNVREKHSILFKDYDFVKHGAKECKASLYLAPKYSFCNIPTNPQNGEKGAKLKLKSRTYQKVVLKAEYFAYAPKYPSKDCEKHKHTPNPKPKPTPYYYKSPPANTNLPLQATTSASLVLQVTTTTYAKLLLQASTPTFTSTLLQNPLLLTFITSLLQVTSSMTYCYNFPSPLYHHQHITTNHLFIRSTTINHHLHLYQLTATSLLILQFTTTIHHHHPHPHEYKSRSPPSPVYYYKSPPPPPYYYKSPPPPPYY